MSLARAALASAPLVLAVAACAGAASDGPRSPGPGPTSMVDTLDAAPSDPASAFGVPLDGGVAWCTAPMPDELRSSIDLTPQTSLRVYAGRCVPAGTFIRACDDAGMPIYVPPCGDEFQGTRLELTTQGHSPITFRAHAIEIVRGPLPDGAWPLDVTERALIVKAQANVGDALREDERVIAIAARDDDWQIPSESFSDVTTLHTAFAFWRNAVCIDPIGCTTARWESSRAGVHLMTSDKEPYFRARATARAQMPTFRAQSPACPLPALLGAARIYTYSRLFGDPEKAALAELDRQLAGLSTKTCPATHAGPQKSVAAIRAEVVRGVKQLLAQGGKRTKR